MTVHAFNTAAKQKQPYVFDLDREVADFYRDYPEHKNKTFFIDAVTATGKLYRGGETDADDVRKLLADNNHLEALILEKNISGMAGAVRYSKAGYGCVILKTPRNQSNVNLHGHSAPPDVADAYSFDHEV